MSVPLSHQVARGRQLATGGGLHREAEENGERGSSNTADLVHRGPKRERRDVHLVHHRLSLRSMDLQLLVHHEPPRCTQPVDPARMEPECTTWIAYLPDKCPAWLGPKSSPDQAC